jgi:hypothetical protein
MAKFFKDMKKGITKACQTVASPLEISWLDEIVDDLLHDYGKFLDAQTNDGSPPTADEATEIENNQFRELNERYDSRSRSKVGRHPRDEQDPIAVRKRILNRGLEARRGKLYSKFAGDVMTLMDSAAKTMKGALDTFNEFEASLRVNDDSN